MFAQSELSPEEMGRVRNTFVAACLETAQTATVNVMHGFLGIEWP